MHHSPFKLFQPARFLDESTHLLPRPVSETPRLIEYLMGDAGDSEQHDMDDDLPTPRYPSASGRHQNIAIDIVFVRQLMSVEEFGRLMEQHFAGDHYQHAMVHVMVVIDKTPTLVKGVFERKE